MLLAGPPDKPQVALTFDDGPGSRDDAAGAGRFEPAWGPRDVFVIGERAQRHPELIKRIVARRSPSRKSLAPTFVGDGVWTYSKTGARTGIGADGDLGCGRKRPRFPGADWHPVATRCRGGADAGAYDCRLTAKARDGWASTSVDAACRRLVGRAATGAILLLHDAGEQLSANLPSRPTIAPAVLAVLLPKLAARGLSAVTLDELCR